MRFIGIDPGLTTGVVSFYVENDDVQQFQAYELDFYGVADWLGSLQLDWNTIIAVESFIISPATAKKSQAPWSLETIGMARYLAWRMGCGLRMVKPSEHKNLITDERLKRAGLYMPGMNHARDAARIAQYVAIVDHGLLKWSLRKTNESLD